MVDFSLSEFRVAANAGGIIKADVDQQGHAQLTNARTSLGSRFVGWVKDQFRSTEDAGREQNSNGKLAQNLRQQLGGSTSAGIADKAMRAAGLLDQDGKLTGARLDADTIKTVFASAEQTTREFQSLNRNTAVMHGPMGPQFSRTDSFDALARAAGVPDGSAGFSNTQLTFIQREIDRAVAIHEDFGSGAISSQDMKTIVRSAIDKTTALGPQAVADAEDAMNHAVDGARRAVELARQGGGTPTDMRNYMKALADVQKGVEDWFAATNTPIGLQESQDLMAEIVSRAIPADKRSAATAYDQMQRAPLPMALAETQARFFEDMSDGIEESIKLASALTNVQSVITRSTGTRAGISEDVLAQQQDAHATKAAQVMQGSDLVDMNVVHVKNSVARQGQQAQHQDGIAV